ncbi:MAG: tRNA threonylcarbamoyladenosine dehydratase [Lachnospiraceae bacterium]|nr:tRNA threonylcarbamoyladenosine dehydratase [Lachnospiraceae bacterium]
MDERYLRTAMIMGQDAVRILSDSHVAVFGVGGVGGYVVEGLARCGIGHIDIIDNDKVCLSNLNRQIIATEKTLGRYKVDVAEERIYEINPNIEVKAHRCFYLPDGKTLDADGNVVQNDPSGKILHDNATCCGMADIDFSRFDYIIDAVDTITAKLGIISEAKKLNIPVISAMGCGNRLDPTKLKVADIFETRGDPLSRIMRKELKKRGIDRLRVVYSTEKPIRPIEVNTTDERICDTSANDIRNESDKGENSFGQNDLSEAKETEDTQENRTRKARRDTPGSAVFVPATAGLIIASIVCRELAGIDIEEET